MLKEISQSNEGASSSKTTEAKPIDRKRITPFVVRTFYKIGGRFDKDAYTYQREVPQSSDGATTTTGKAFFVT